MKAHRRAVSVRARKPLILLFNSRSPSERTMLSEWLASQSFLSYEASDTLDAIDMIADFTTASLPEVVTIPGSVQDDVTTVSELISSFLDGNAELPVFLYSQERNAGVRSLSIEEVGQWLQGRSRRGDS